MAEKVAKFRLKDYKITQSHFSINPEKISAKDNMAIEIKRENLLNESESLFKLDMSVNMSDERGNINISIKIEGLFEFDSDLNETQKNNFFDINAPAILYPYVRAYLSSLTSLSGFSHIILPTINFAARSEKNK